MQEKRPHKKSKTAILSRLIEVERALRESQKILAEIRKNLHDDINSNPDNYSEENESEQPYDRRTERTT